MVCFGSKTLERRGFRRNNLAEIAHTGEEEDPTHLRRKKRDTNKKPRRGHPKMAGKSLSKKGGRKKDKNEKKKKRQLTKDVSSDNPSTAMQIAYAEMSSRKHLDSSKSQATVLRKRVDPDTAKYFSEIANLFEGNEVDIDDRPIICGNALIETRGKELELATDMIVSYTLQKLLQGCDLDQLCAFLRNCANELPLMALDKFGSHVAETALKSLSVYLLDEESHSIIEDTLHGISQVLVHDYVSLMCSCYGSHVLRSLLCLCKGVPVGSLGQFHVTRRSTVLAERLNSKPAQSIGKIPLNFQCGFENVFKFLIREMLNHAKDEIGNLVCNQYSSLVLQTALKLLVGDEQMLLEAILVLLGCKTENIAQGKFIESTKKPDIMTLMNDTSSNHLLEVMIEVAPDSLYCDFLYEVFKGSLFQISLHECGNFVVQALVSSARSPDQVDLIWGELGTKFKDLLESGKSGVAASLLAACARLQVHAKECCQALAAAVSSESESSSCIIPHLLFLENFFKERSCWEWKVGEKMHTLGCLLLQTIFRFPKHFIRPYISSMTSMEADHIFQTAQDAGGSRVLEAFLCSDASAKQKQEVIAKLQGHFGELSLHPSSSFTVEKCFTSTNMNMKEAVASELLAIRPELSKTKHGPYLLKKLDIDEFGRRPDQWKSRLASKENTYREFQATFGSETKHRKRNAPAQHSSENSKKKPKGHKMITDENDHGFDASIALAPSKSFEDIPGLESSLAKLGFPGDKHKQKKRNPADAKPAVERDAANFTRNTASTRFESKSGKRKSTASELADLAGKTSLSPSDVRKLFKTSIKSEGSEKVAFLKKQRRK